MVKKSEQTHDERRHMDAKEAFENMLIMIFIRELQIETTMRYHYIPIIMAKIQNLTIPNADRCGAAGILIHYCW